MVTDYPPSICCFEKGKYYRMEFLSRVDAVLLTGSGPMLGVATC